MKAPDFDTLELIDYCPETDTFLEEVQAGLAQRQKRIPSKFFYDARGSQLFDAITELPEYYPTRTEMTIMERSIGEMVTRIGPRALLVEYGSGSSLKTRILLDNLIKPVGYLPIDISREHLLQSAAVLKERYSHLDIIPVCADYTTDFHLPKIDGARPVMFFPGSTIGNFTPEEAAEFLRHLVEVVGPGGGLLIGVDLRKDVAVIEAAYNDAQGVTAAFNKNVLIRINNELGGTFQPNRFEHRAFFNDAHSRIEMHLVSLGDQCVRVGEMQIPFHTGETILTEYSYKYSLAHFTRLAHEAGFAIEQVWTDERNYFSVQYLVAR